MGKWTNYLVYDYLMRHGHVRVAKKLEKFLKIEKFVTFENTCLEQVFKWYKESSKNNETSKNGGLKNHNCDQCDKQFRDPIELMRHVNSVHQRVKNNKCNICGNVFSNPGNLKTHINSVHKVVMYLGFKCWV